MGGIGFGESVCTEVIKFIRVTLLTGLTPILALPIVLATLSGTLSSKPPRLLHRQAI